MNKKTKAKKILVIMPSISIQGMERSTLQIMSMLRKNGFDIHFISNQVFGDSARNEIEKIQCSNTDVLFIKKPELSINPLIMFSILYSWLRSSFNIYKVFKEIKPDYIHITNIDNYLFCLPFLLFVNTKIVFRLPNPPNPDYQGLKGLLNKTVWGVFVKRFTHLFVCNSRHSLNILTNYIGQDINKTLIYNCLTERTLPGVSDAPSISNEGINIVYLGRISINKGVKELYEASLELVSKFDDVNLYFVGENDWNNPFAEKLMTDVKYLKLQNRLIFINQIKDVFSLLAKAHIHICPSISKHESFPNVILEAKYHSIPSVVFPTAGLPEAVEHLKDGYICSDKSAESLYNGIKYLLDNKEQFSVMGKNAKLSLAKFSQKNAETEWLNVYK